MALYELAFTLRVPMYQLQNDMSYRELGDWAEYFQRRPAGWNDDLRASYIMQSMGAKAKGQEIFPSLATIYKEAEENEAAQVAKLKKNPFLQEFLMPHLENNDGD